MHDKYYYEAAEMALIDTDVRRTFATGIAGFSHVVDSLSAIKYAKVKTIRDENGTGSRFRDRPEISRDTETMMTRADDIAVWLLRDLPMRRLEKRSHLPRFRGYYIHSDHYIKRGIWKGNRSNAGRKKSMDTAVTGSKPELTVQRQNGSVWHPLNSVAKLPYE